MDEDSVETLNFAPYTTVEIGNTTILDYRESRKKDLLLRESKQVLSPQQLGVFNTVGDLKAFYEVTVTETAKGSWYKS